MAKCLNFRVLPHECFFLSLPHLSKLPIRVQITDPLQYATNLVRKHPMPFGLIQYRLNFNDNFSNPHDALSFGSIQLTDSLHDATTLVRKHPMPFGVIQHLLNFDHPRRTFVSCPRMQTENMFSSSFDQTSNKQIVKMSRGLCSKWPRLCTYMRSNS